MAIFFNFGQCNVKIVGNILVGWVKSVDLCLKPRLSIFQNDFIYNMAKNNTFNSF